VLPVAGVAWREVRDSWGEARGGGTRGHSGTDIMAPAGTPVVAAAAGTVEKLFYSHGGGGITVYVRAPDRRLSYYYAHLAGYAPGVREGMRVRAGQRIGYVGDTGNAGPGNTHLHFGIERLLPDEPWHRGRAVDPYPLLAHGRQRR
jgi:peptidoglycan LD-endopeptidase LytH